MAVLDSVLKAYQSPTRIVHAIGALSALGQETAALNVKRPLVVTDQGLVKAGLLDEALKIRWIGSHFLFRSSCITGESPRSPVWRNS